MNKKSLKRVLDKFSPRGITRASDFSKPNTSSTKNESSPLLNIFATFVDYWKHFIFRRGIWPSNPVLEWGIWTQFWLKGAGIWTSQPSKVQMPGALPWGGGGGGGCWCFELIGALLTSRDISDLAQFIGLDPYSSKTSLHGVFDCFFYFILFLINLFFFFIGDQKVDQLKGRKERKHFSLRPLMP